MSNFTRITLPTRGSSVFKKLLSVIFLAPAAVFLSAWSFQDGEEKVTIKGSDVPLITVFKTIKKQTGYSFFYAADYVNDQEKVSVDVKNAKVDDVLRKLLGGDYVWVYNENAVSITKKKEEVGRSSLASIPDSSVTQITVSGLVTDAKGTPVPGATVVVKGTKDGANTDEFGRFSLPSVATGAVLVISSVGFERREMQVKGKTILAKLNISVNDLDEAVVVAYNTTTLRANTAAVTVVKGRQIESMPYRSFDKGLQGLVPGLQITNGTGQPGGGVSNMVLRGVSTGTEAFYGSTVRNPLIVIDGIPVSQDGFKSIGRGTTPITNPLAQLNTSDIETVSILKDAAAIALYGSKASNGVILVTTKKGRAGKTVYSFRHQTDIARISEGKTKMLNRDEYLDLLYETYKNTPRNSSLWTDALIKTDLIAKFPIIVDARGDTSFYQATDWFRELYNNQASTLINELSMSGGNEKSNFYLNVEWTKQNGVVKRTGYDRKSLRFNFENKTSDALKLGINATLSYNVQDLDNSSFTGFRLQSGLNPVRSVDGTYVLNYQYPLAMPNPAAAAEYNINRNTTYRGLTKFYGELHLFKYFTLSSNLGVDFMLAEVKEKQDPRLIGIASVGEGRINENVIRRANIIYTNTLRFDRSFGKEHSVNVLIGQEGQILTEKVIGGETRGASTNPPLPYYDELSSPGYSIIQFFGGSTSRQTLLSLFGQVNYGYKERYYVSGSLRRDGSSRFGGSQQWGIFWSTGAGWVLSSEQFMKSAANWLDYLKVRGSIGAAGSSAAVMATTRYNLLERLGGLPYTAFTPGFQPGNPDIQWEETFTWNAGLETRFLKERLSIIADIYNKRTKDLIYTTLLPSVSGYTDVLDNIGVMKNRGIEISLSLDVIRNRHFRWNIGANWSSNRNELVKANVPLAAITGNILANEEGRNFNSFYLRRWAGVDPTSGKPLWIDSTGKFTSEYNSAKREFMGKPQPDGFGIISNTFSYRDIELSATLYYQYGFQVYNSDSYINDGGTGAGIYDGQDKRALDRWQKPGDVAKNPRRLINNKDGGTRESTRFLSDGDYIRLQMVSLAYNFPNRVLHPLRLSTLRVFIQGHNLALLTKFPGKDPDNANVEGRVNNPYLLQRTFSFGLNLNF